MKLTVTKSLDLNEKNSVASMKENGYSKSATELLHLQSDVKQKSDTSSNFLQLPKPENRRHSYVSFSLFEEKVSYAKEIQLVSPKRLREGRPHEIDK